MVIVLSYPDLSCLHVFPHSFSHIIQVLDRLDCLRVVAFGRVIPRVLEVVLGVLVLSSEKWRLLGSRMDSVFVTELCEG